jgi:hypothetical protein
MTRIVEIRTHRLHPGTATEYERLFSAVALPMLARQGIESSRLARR